MGTQRDRVRPGYGEGRKALLDAAVRVVAAKGLRGLTFRAVAAEAGVTQGLVSHHFGTRQVLIREAIRAAGVESIGSTLAPERNHDLAGFVEGLQAYLDETVELQAFQYEIALEARRDAELHDVVVELYDAYRAATRDALAATGAAHDPITTRLVFAALDGLSFQQLVYGPDAQTDACVQRLRTLLADGAPGQGAV